MELASSDDELSVKRPKGDPDSSRRSMSSNLRFLDLLERPECMLRILGNLERVDLLNVAASCKTLYQYSWSESSLWRELELTDSDNGVMPPRLGSLIRKLPRNCVWSITCVTDSRYFSYLKTLMLSNLGLKQICLTEFSEYGGKKP